MVVPLSFWNVQKRELGKTDARPLDVQAPPTPAHDQVNQRKKAIPTQAPRTKLSSKRMLVCVPSLIMSSKRSHFFNRDRKKNRERIRYAGTHGSRTQDSKISV